MLLYQATVMQLLIFTKIMHDILPILSYSSVHYIAHYVSLHCGDSHIMRLHYKYKITSFGIDRIGWSSSLQQSGSKAIMTIFFTGGTSLQSHPQHCVSIFILNFQVDVRFGQKHTKNLLIFTEYGTMKRCTAVKKKSQYMYLSTIKLENIMMIIVSA